MVVLVIETLRMESHDFEALAIFRSFAVTISEGTDEKAFLLRT